jgi:glutamate/tyrosine decarboxylase-like PLP-dependent enzyme
MSMRRSASGRRRRRAWRRRSTGIALADSWATDAHKWLNVPYDCGLALVRDPAALQGAMGIRAAYLPDEDRREPSRFGPELSRRGRGIEAWAALKHLGRDGLAAMIERCCAHARRFAAGLAEAGHAVLNEVVLNQVLVSFGSAARTRRVIAAVQAEGTCWCSGTVWQGHTAMRISVSSWATTAEDVERSLAAILRIAADEASQPALRLGRHAWAREEHQADHRGREAERQPVAQRRAAAAKQVDEPRAARGAWRGLAPGAGQAAGCRGAVRAGCDSGKASSSARSCRVSPRRHYSPAAGRPAGGIRAMLG